MYFAIACRRSWFWLQYIDAFNGFAIKRKFSATAVVYSDASKTGFGGYSALVGSHVSCGNWSEFDAAQSSTFRELKALLHVLQSFAKVLSDLRVKWFSHGLNTCRIVSVGSPKPVLQALAICIFEVCMSFDIAIEMEWLPRSQNERADFLSRIVDLDDWSVNPELFRLVDSRWGPHTVDRFSSFYNAQIGRFNSRFWNPGSEAVDVSTQDWSLDNNWLCPPISLVVRAVRHLIACKGTGTLIIPEWPSSYFWPFVNPTNGAVKRIVQDCIILPRICPVFVAGRGQLIQCNGRKSVFSGNPSFRVLALRLDCS